MYIVYNINVFLVFHVEHYYNRIKNFCILYTSIEGRVYKKSYYIFLHGSTQKTRIHF